MQNSTDPISSRTCPQCGSPRLKRVNPEGLGNWVYDRLCLDCNHRFTPPTPQYLQRLDIPCGIFLCALPFIAAIAMWITADGPVTLDSMLLLAARSPRRFFGCVVIAAALIAGGSALVRRGRRGLQADSVRQPSSHS